MPLGWSEEDAVVFVLRDGEVRIPIDGSTHETTGWLAIQSIAIAANGNTASSCTSRAYARVGQHTHGKLKTQHAVAKLEGGPSRSAISD